MRNIIFLLRLFVMSRHTSPCLHGERERERWMYVCEWRMTEKPHGTHYVFRTEKKSSNLAKNAQFRPRRSRFSNLALNYFHPKLSLSPLLRNEFIILPSKYFWHGASSKARRLHSLLASSLLPGRIFHIVTTRGQVARKHLSSNMIPSY